MFHACTYLSHFSFLNCFVFCLSCKESVVPRRHVPCNAQDIAPPGRIFLDEFFRTHLGEEGGGAHKHIWWRWEGRSCRDIFEHTSLGVCTLLRPSLPPSLPDVENIRVEICPRGCAILMARVITHVGADGGHRWRK